MKIARTLVMAFLALVVVAAMLRQWGGRWYLATENANFEEIREKSKLDCASMPLHCAVEASDIGRLRMLLKDGADTSDTDNWGRTALHWGAVHAREEAVAVLLDAGASTDVRDEHGEPLIVGAARAGNVEIVRALLDAGAPINPSRPGAQTPLHAAVATNNLEMVELLLARGADLGAHNATGQGSLDLATTYRYPGPPVSEAILEVLRRAAGPRGEGADKGPAAARTKPELLRKPEPGQELEPSGEGALPR